MKKLLAILVAGVMSTSAFAVSTASDPASVKKPSATGHKSASGTHHKKNHKAHKKSASGATSAHKSSASKAM